MNLLDITDTEEQWGLSVERAAKKKKPLPSPGKVIATVFWDVPALIHVDYLEKEKTIAGAY